jgi:hypothetical protein
MLAVPHLNVVLSFRMDSSASSVTLAGFGFLGLSCARAFYAHVSAASQPPMNSLPCGVKKLGDLRNR